MEMALVLESAFKQTQTPHLSKHWKINMKNIASTLILLFVLIGCGQNPKKTATTLKICELEPVDVKFQEVPYLHGLV